MSRSHVNSIELIAGVWTPVDTALVRRRDAIWTKHSIEDWSLAPSEDVEALREAHNEVVASAVVLATKRRKFGGIK